MKKRIEFCELEKHRGRNYIDLGAFEGDYLDADFENSTSRQFLVIGKWRRRGETVNAQIYVKTVKEFADTLSADKIFNSEWDEWRIDEL